MFVLITSANFPDVMLPSYNENRLNVVFFIVYIIVGMFTLMQLLLAIFYNSYQFKTNSSIEFAEEDRTLYVT